MTCILCKKPATATYRDAFAPGGEYGLCGHHDGAMWKLVNEARAEPMARIAVLEAENARLREALKMVRGLISYLRGTGAVKAALVAIDAALGGERG